MITEKIKAQTVLIDLNLESSKTHTPEVLPRGIADEFRENDFCSADGFYTDIRISKVPRALRRQFQSQELLLLGSVPHNGFCPTGLSREFDGSRISGFLQAIPYSPVRRLLHHQSEKTIRLQATSFNACRQDPRREIRTSRSAEKLLSETGISRTIAAHSLFRFHNAKPFDFPHQQFSSLCFDYCRPLSMPMAGGTVLPLDQAAPKDKGLLRYLGQCRETQIWIAISIYVLVAIVKKRLNLDRSLYSILLISGIRVLFDDRDPIPRVLQRFR
jgi:hypothetical protein